MKDKFTMIITVFDCICAGICAVQREWLLCMLWVLITMQSVEILMLKEGW